MYKKPKICHNNIVASGGIMKSSHFKKYQDVRAKSFIKDHKLENELGVDYFEKTASYINPTKSNTNELVTLSEKCLNKQYSKSNN